MVNFELGKEIEEDVFSSCHEHGTKKKFWVPTRNRTLELRCSTTEQQRLYDEQDILRSSYDTRPEYR